MQANQTSLRSMSPILDLIGAAPVRGRQADGELPFESLLDSRPQPLASPTPPPSQSLAKHEPQQASEAQPSRASEVSKDQPADEPADSLESNTEDSTRAKENSAEADVAVKGESEPDVDDSDSEAAPADAATAENLAAALAAIGVTNQPVLVENVAPAADETAPAGEEEGAIESAAATPAVAQVGSLEESVGIEVAVPAIPSEEAAVVPAGSSPGAVVALDKKAAVQPQAATTENAASQPLDQTAEAEAVEPGLSVEAVATGDDESTSNGDSEPKGDSERAAPQPPIQASAPELLDTRQADAQAGLPQPTVVAPAEAASRDGISSAFALPAADASPAKTRLPASILGEAGIHNGRQSAEVAVDSVRLLQRVARAFAAANERGGEVRLRLSPPELGALRLEVQIQDGAMVARVEAETSAAKAAIIENLPALRERLAEQGVRIERFEVDLMNQQGPGTPDRQANGDREFVEQSRQVLPAPARREAAAAPASGPTAVGGQGRLNVII